jgi:hypothetical protein
VMLVRQALELAGRPAVELGAARPGADQLSVVPQNDA